MVRIQSPSTDPMRVRGYERSEFKPSNQPYQYKAYEPSSVGIYGQKPRQLRTYSKPDKPPPKPKVAKSKTTFNSYSLPLGPDIKVDNMGPAFQNKKYEYKEYKPRPITPYKARPLTPRDPFKAQSLHVDERSRLYTQDVTYKLDKENNASLRNWNYGFVDDTVASKRSKPTPQEKYNVKEKPKAEVTERKRTPVFAAVAPVNKSSPKPKTPPPPKPIPPPPVSKSYKNSSTQHIGPGIKTTTTQTQVSNTRTFGTQSEPDRTPSVPVVAPVPVPMSAKKVKTKSQGIQYSESPKQTSVKGTQYDSPKTKELTTQTEHMYADSPKTKEYNTEPKHVYAPVQARKTSPEYAEVARTETPVYSRCSPPKVVPIVAPVPKSQTPKRQSPVKQITPIQAPVETRWTPSPEVVQVQAPENLKAIPTKEAKVVSPKEAIVDTKPEVSSYQAASKSGRNPFPYQTAKSRLPPEITAYIEAYDFAHGPA